MWYHSEHCIWFSIKCSLVTLSLKRTDIRLVSRPYIVTMTHELGSLKVIENDTLRSGTRDFLLTFHSNYRPISHRFRDKRQFTSKIANFSHPCVQPLLKWFALELGIGAGVRRNQNDGARVVSFKIGLVVLIQYGHVTDRHPASHVAVASTTLASVAQVRTTIRTFDLRFLGFLKTLKT